MPDGDGLLRPVFTPEETRALVFVANLMCDVGAHILDGSERPGVLPLESAAMKLEVVLVAAGVPQ